MTPLTQYGRMPKSSQNVWRIACICGVVTSRMLCSKIEIMNATAIPECQTLDVKASATELEVCEETIRRLVRRKVIRKLPGLRRVLIPRSEIHRFLNGGGRSRFS